MALTDNGVHRPASLAFRSATKLVDARTEI